MAKSFKKEFMDVLGHRSLEYKITVGSNQIPLYTVNKDILTANVDIQSIIKCAKLSGKTKPIAIIQYAIPYPGTEQSYALPIINEDQLLPMLAFIWSWGGPWAYVYNIQYPSWSEYGSVPFHRVKQFVGFVFHNGFNFITKE